jgi:hypothetical protein
MTKQKQTTHKGNRYDIQFVVLRGKKVPFAYFGTAYGYNLLQFSIEQAEDMYLSQISQKDWSIYDEELRVYNEISSALETV